MIFFVGNPWGIRSLMLRFNALERRILFKIPIHGFSPFFHPMAFLLLAVGFSSPVFSMECPAQEGTPVSSIELQGLRQTHPSVVKDALENRKGNRFSCPAWEGEHNRLRDLGIFASVELAAQSSGDSVSLIYRFQELPPYIPLASVNKTDQDGFSIGPSVAALNFLGTGKRVDVMARFGGSTEYQAAISGRQLFGHPVEFNAAWIHVNSYNPFDTSHENSHRFKAEGFWPAFADQHFGIIGLAEYFWIQSDSAQITLRSGGDAVPRLGIGLRWDSRDRVLLPRRGFFSETRFTQNGGFLGGPADYWEELIDLRGYLPLARRHGLVVDALYQYRRATLDSNMGRYDDFHAGGANTLRGYHDNAFQGQNECLVNVEYRFDALEERVQKLGPWSLNYGVQLVTGIDAASLWSGNEARPEAFHPGVYTGIHILVPGIERIRFELGTQTAKFDLHFNLGLFEKTTVQRFRTR